MKAIILAGGLGSRLSEETQFKPKPMVEIGGKPILWHIMKIYSFYGIKDFIICCGYKKYLIEQYFSNFSFNTLNVNFTSKKNIVKVKKKKDNWNITLVDTGKNTMTGGRLKRVENFIKEKEVFCFTYGDGLADINISNLISFHKKHGNEATITTVNPTSKFGFVDISKNNVVKNFNEKPRLNKNWINGGFFVLNKSVLKRISGDQSVWEQQPLKSLVMDKQLIAYKHQGFWKCMDTLKDKNELNELWNSNKASWKKW
jgi:glucose-1-phosphate cytidylyltransferase